MKQKNNQRRITVSEMAPHVHTFFPYENKVEKISLWLANWIEKSLSEGKIKYGDFLPTKGDLAFHIGVSLGTMQNVFRIIEDKGLVESKQRIGTYIKGKDNSIDKLVSKREVVCNLIKKELKEKNYNVGDNLPPIRKLANILNVQTTTLRIALNTLIEENVISKQGKIFTIKKLDYKINNSESKTLVEKVAGYINDYIKKESLPNGRLPSNHVLADMYNVSVKTIHDALKILAIAGIVTSKRGYYGTTVNSQNDSDTMYFYEQVELKIRRYIAENCKIGDKLPSVKEFSEVFEVSTKTIKNALDVLASDNVVNFLRGRNGGTFVLQMPKISEQGYTWLALSPDFEIKN